MASTSGRHFSLTYWSITSRTASCLTLYLLRSNATWQWFKMCASVCLSPHNLQWLDKPSLHLHIARFALCGRVSWAAFKANLRASGGSFCTVSDHRVAASLSISRCSSPWWGRLRECSRHSSISADFTASLALLIKVCYYHFLYIALAWTAGSAPSQSAAWPHAGWQSPVRWWAGRHDSHASSYRVVRLLVDLGLHSSWAGTVLLDPLSVLDLTTSSGSSGLQACVDPCYGQVRDTQVTQHSGANGGLVKKKLLMSGDRDCIHLLKKWGKVWLEMLSWLLSVLNVASYSGHVSLLPHGLGMRLLNV